MVNGFLLALAIMGVATPSLADEAYDAKWEKVKTCRDACLRKDEGQGEKRRECIYVCQEKIMGGRENPFVDMPGHNECQEKYQKCQEDKCSDAVEEHKKALVQYRKDFLTCAKKECADEVASHKKVVSCKACSARVRYPAGVQCNACKDFLGKCFSTFLATAKPRDGKAASSSDEAGAGQRYRKEILAILEKFEDGATEGDKLYKEFKSADEVANSRALSPGWTSCVDWAAHVQNLAATKAKATKLLKFGVNTAFSQANTRAEKVAMVPGAWHDCTKGASSKLQEGDIMVFNFEEDTKDKKHRKGEFSHVAILLKKTDNGKLLTLRTVDGGQGSSTKDKIDHNDRMFDPDTCLIAGEKNQGDAKTRMVGWANVEKLVK